MFPLLRLNVRQKCQLLSLLSNNKQTTSPVFSSYTFEDVRIEPRASEMLGKYSILESHSSSTYIHFDEHKKRGKRNQDLKRDIVA